jgi:uncharacterized membrane protein YphA (DoxX/SURF4 family)
MRNAPRAYPSRRRTVVVWTLTIVTAAAFAAAGVFKVLGSEQMVTTFVGFGFPLWFMTLVGIAELTGALALLLPPVAFLGGLGLMGLAGGAFITHMASGDPVTAAIPAIVLFVLPAVVTWLRARVRASGNPPVPRLTTYPSTFRPSRIVPA